MQNKELCSGNGLIIDLMTQYYNRQIDALRITEAPTISLPFVNYDADNLQIEIYEDLNNGKITISDGGYLFGYEFDEEGADIASVIALANIWDIVLNGDKFEVTFDRCDFNQNYEWFSHFIVVADAILSDLCV